MTIATENLGGDCFCFDYQIIDGRFPARGVDGVNVVQLYDPATNVLKPIFLSESGDLLWARFVSGGDQVMTGLNYPSGDFGEWATYVPAQSDEADRWWRPIEMTDIAGLADGWLVTSGNQLIEYNAFDRSDTVRLNMRYDEHQILWVHNALPVSQTVTEWPNLEDRFVDGVPFPPNTMVVVTEAGNQLRMRVELGGTIQRQFNTGDTIRVVGGPREVDGLTWWQVQDEHWMRGWVAEGDGTVAYIERAPR